MALNPECFLGSDPALRRQALYDAFGGTDCFLGLSPDEQEQKLYEALGGTNCFRGLSREERRYALYVAIGGDDPCFRGSSPQQQETLFYEAMYALAGDATLVDPACFRGLSPDERSYWMFRASVVTGNPHPECVAIMGETGSTYVLQAGDEGYYIRCKVTATNSEGSDFAWSNAVGPVAAAASGGPTLVFTEPFTYANGALAAVSGGVWTLTRGGVQVIGNAVAGNDASFGVAYHSTAVNSDQRVEITITAAGAATYVGVAARVQAGGDCYLVIASSVDMELDQISGGTVTIIQTVGTGLSVGDKLAIEVSGSGALTRIKVQKDIGAGWVDVWTNQNPSADIDGGSAGVAGYGSAATTRGDDLKAYNL